MMFSSISSSIFVIESWTMIFTVKNMILTTFQSTLLLGKLEPMYHIKTTTVRHQCLTRSAARTLMTQGVLNDYLNPNTSSMKIIAWNCQGAGIVTFRNHAYELHRRHRPQILIIVEPRIAEEWAQAVILLVSPEAYDCYGMRVPPSKWKFSPTVSIVSMHL